MAKWKLMAERADLRGRVLFYDTGRTIEAPDNETLHALLEAEKAKDGRCYGAMPFTTPIQRLRNWFAQK